MKVKRVEKLDGGVRRVDGHVRGRLEKRLGVVEDDLDAAGDEIVGRLLRSVRRDGEHAGDDVLLADRRRELFVRAHGDIPDRVADLARILVEDRSDVDAVLGEDRRTGDRLAEPSCADQRDVVLALRTEYGADLSEERIDVVADASLTEFAERRQVAADLRGVDVRVLRYLLRGDSLLAHLARLRKHLEVPREARRHSDREAICHQFPLLDSTLVTAKTVVAVRPRPSLVQLPGGTARVVRSR